MADFTDISKADQGEKEAYNTRFDMKGFNSLLSTYETEQPLKGTRISGCVTVTYETANFILTLKKLGADLRWCPDNPKASKDDACAYIQDSGIPLFAKSNMTPQELYKAYNDVLNFANIKSEIIGPNLVIDDGCDITRFIHRFRPELLKDIIGISEQTACGIQEQRIMQTKGELKVAVIDINSSSIKSLYDNYYGVQQSLISSLDRLKIQIRGKTAVIAGYGFVGKGCAKALSALGSKVIITEIDHHRALEADMDGLHVMRMEDASTLGDIFISATGNVNVITKEHFLNMKNGAILCNMGHGDREFDTDYLRKYSVERKVISEYLDVYTLENYKQIRVACDGYLLNMRIGLGNPPVAMTITFLHHIFALMELYRNPDKFKKGEIYRLGKEKECEIINHVFPEIEKNLTILSEEQKIYINRK